MTHVVTLTEHADVIAALRSKALRQALYDAGDVVMADVLVNLHADEHRARRRLENRLFRRDAHERYERALFPEVIDRTMRPHLAEGGCELVELSHQLMMNLAALTAGVDRPLGTPQESLHLYDYLMRFIEGATLAHYTGDRAAKRAEVATAMQRFDAEFLAPSIERRRTLIAREAEGGVLAPDDVLTVLLRNDDALHLPHDVVLREICFFLLAGAHTSATAFTRTLHHLFGWLADHPYDAERLRSDRLFVQRCVHETIRLQPSSPIAMRWALSEVTLPGGRVVPEGAQVVLDLLAVNHDPRIWGPDAAAFNPDRVVPDGHGPWGLSFGSGMHACIGQDLAGGLAHQADRDPADHLFGLVPIAVQWMVTHAARPDPAHPPVADPASERGYWSSYGVLLG
ncbi:MAG: cytochrome P450 [Acidimicrobiales bacterium]